MGSLLAASWIVLGYFLHGYQEGWGSLIVTILLSTGIIMMTLGVNGIYLSKAYEQVKRRPLFLIDEEI